LLRKALRQFRSTPAKQSIGAHAGKAPTSRTAMVVTSELRSRPRRIHRQPAGLPIFALASAARLRRFAMARISRSNGAVRPTFQIRKGYFVISLKNLCIAVFADLMLASGAMAANTYTLDPAHTQTVFIINHLGYSMVTGNFHDLKGTLLLDEKKPENSTVSVTIGTASVDTGVPARDDVLRSKTFFGAADFPTMEFHSTRVRMKGKKTVDVEGNLTLLGISNPVVLRVVFNRTAPDQMRNNTVVAGFTGTTTIKRSDFGMKAYLPYIGDDVKVTVNFEGIQQ
jgi:polyisoprenoid-binding protein YceI